MTETPMTEELALDLMEQEIKDMFIEGMSVEDCDTTAAYVLVAGYKRLKDRAEKAEQALSVSGERVREACANVLDAAAEKAGHDKLHGSCPAERRLAEAEEITFIRAAQLVRVLPLAAQPEGKQQ